MFVERGVLKTPEVIEVCRRVDPKDFMDDFLEVEEGDASEPSGASSTVSATDVGVYAMVAYMVSLELLFPALSRPHARVLDLGAGSGFVSTCLAHLVRPYHGTVVGVERDKRAREQTRGRLLRHPSHASLLSDGTLSLVPGDALLGHPTGAPYDAVHCGGAVASLPRTWLQQLKVDGVLLAAVVEDAASERQSLQRVKKVGGDKVLVSRIMDVHYDLLTDAAVEADK